MASPSARSGDGLCGRCRAEWGSRDPPVQDATSSAPACRLLFCTYESSHFPALCRRAGQANAGPSNVNPPGFTKPGVIQTGLHLPGLLGQRLVILDINLVVAPLYIWRPLRLDPGQHGHDLIVAQHTVVDGHGSAIVGLIDALGKAMLGDGKQLRIRMVPGVAAGIVRRRRKSDIPTTITPVGFFVRARLTRRRIAGPPP